jgi:hypothetical protein
MKIIGACLLLLAVVRAQQDAAGVAQQADLSRKVTYYTDQKSVQYIVIDLAQQVGLRYNWDKSFAATDPERRRFVHNVSIENKPFAKAMATILDPVQLAFRVEGDKVVLYRR